MGKMMAVSVVCAIAVVAVGAFTGCSDRTKTQAAATENVPAPTPDRPAQPGPAQPDVANEIVEVTAGELVEDYIANEIGADARYRNKILRVTGFITHIGRNDGKPLVSFMVIEAPKNELRATFSTEAGLGDLKPQQTIAVRCRGGSAGRLPILTDCVFERVIPEDEGS